MSCETDSEKSLDEVESRIQHYTTIEEVLTIFLLESVAISIILYFSLFFYYGEVQFCIYLILLTFICYDITNSHFYLINTILIYMCGNEYYYKSSFRFILYFSANLIGFALFMIYYDYMPFVTLTIENIFENIEESAHFQLACIETLMAAMYTYFACISMFDNRMRNTRKKYFYCVLMALTTYMIQNIKLNLIRNSSSDYNIHLNFGNSMYFLAYYYYIFQSRCRVFSECYNSLLLLYLLSDFVGILIGTVLWLITDRAYKFAYKQVLSNKISIVPIEFQKEYVFPYKADQKYDGNHEIDKKKAFSNNVVSKLNKHFKNQKRIKNGLKDTLRSSESNSDIMDCSGLHHFRYRARSSHNKSCKSHKSNSSKD